MEQVEGAVESARLRKSAQTAAFVRARAAAKSTSFGAPKSATGAGRHSLPAGIYPGFSPAARRSIAAASTSAHIAGFGSDIHDPLLRELDQPRL